MNYEKSKEILSKIKSVDRIAVNCHRNPDPDSIGSALALYGVLSDMGKKVELICPSKIEWKTLNYLKNFAKIKTIDYSKYDFSKHQLLIILDSSSWDVVTDISDYKPPKIPVAVIDHHRTNTAFGEINLVDENATSTGELLYRVFEDWGVTINKDTAMAILTGIIGDTGTFSYPGTGAQTLKIAGELLEKGADKDRIVQQIYRSVDFKMVQFWGEVINNAKVDKVNKFIWSAIPHARYKELGSLIGGRESIANLIGGTTEGTDFGIVMVEQEPKKLTASFRSRTGIDVSVLTQKLGGGGHRYAAGVRITGLTFDDAVARVLTMVRESINEAKRG
ncbi:MAG: Phosphoesterase RecJ domain protein [Candidatus Woesebacteria bacterium GW2011_GWC1_42_9]|nr:MAG: Phosphoesterase RecJ domain protein [Candidatus Woesebacteria bacterium GW2011_GWC1_42_9]